VQGANCHIVGRITGGGERRVLPTSRICVDLPIQGLLMGTPSDVASDRLHVLHIRLNLPEN
jgi:hypothetical protein